MRFHGPSIGGRTDIDTGWQFSECHGMSCVNEIRENVVLHRQLGRSIGICGRGWSLASEDMKWAGEENKSLLKVDKELSQWIHGPFIAIGHDGNFVPDGPDGKAMVPWYDQVYDLEPVDFSHIVDRMRGEHYRSGREGQGRTHELRR